MAMKGYDFDSLVRHVDTDAMEQLAVGWWLVDGGWWLVAGG